MTSWYHARRRSLMRQPVTSRRPSKPDPVVVAASEVTPPPLTTWRTGTSPFAPTETKVPK
jgi:hypothetical protein